MGDNPQLKLDNQLCFPLYAAHRLVTRMYQPLLDELDISYPQYLILLVLWEADNQSVTGIGNKLFLSSNTLTPLLKRMEKKGLIKRTRSHEDERKVVISLTGKGILLEEEACLIPAKLMGEMGEGLASEELIRLREDLKKLITMLPG